MNRHARLRLCLAAILMVLVGAMRPVCADGVPITIEGSEVEMPAQQAIIVWDPEGGHEDLILSVELLGGPEAAWVVPIPSLPEVKATSPRWFEHLSDLTKPKIKEEIKVVHTPIMAEVGEGSGEGVELLSREELGVYDVSILSADEPGALLDWLNENGYAFPEEGEPLLDAYVEEGGWFFVAARVLPSKFDRLQGDVHPLWFSFDVERPIYPMRLTSLVENTVGILIYVLADHRMSNQRFVTEFAGELSLRPLSQESDAGLVDLLTHRPYYVTKLINRGFRPSAVEEDLYFERAASDEPYQRVSISYRYVYRPESEPPPSQDGHRLAFWVGLAVLGLLAGLGLAWRRRSRR